MKRRPGETVQQWNDRTNRTCYSCGHEFATIAQCDRHEDSKHGGSGGGKRKS